MTETFDNPLSILDQQDRYAEREVGITHPDVSGFVRIRDNGDIEIVAAEGLAILMHPKNNSITFVADHINFMTKEEKGLRWNHVNFNDRATSFHEPTFIVRDDSLPEAYELFEGVDVFTKSDEEGNRVLMVTDEMGNRMTLEEYAQTLPHEEEEEQISEEYMRHPPRDLFSE